MVDTKCAKCDAPVHPLGEVCGDCGHPRKPTPWVSSKPMAGTNEAESQHAFENRIRTFFRGLIGFSMIGLVAALGVGFLIGGLG